MKPDGPRSRSAKLSFTEHPVDESMIANNSSGAPPGTSVTRSGKRGGVRVALHHTSAAVSVTSACVRQTAAHHAALFAAANRAAGSIPTGP